MCLRNRAPLILGEADGDGAMRGVMFAVGAVIHREVAYFETVMYVISSILAKRNTLNRRIQNLSAYRRALVPKQRTSH